jgi:CYTH domain-containing protein
MLRQSTDNLGYFSRALVLDKNGSMPHHKYTRVERERRFLVHQFPRGANVVQIRRIMDSYIEGTTLRLREQKEDGSDAVFKLTQKIPARAGGAQQGFITTIYLTQDEFCLLAQIPSKKLSKTRYSIPPFGIDVFEGPLQGLILAEAEFDSAEVADALPIPSFAAEEVTTDDRFTGGRLVQSSREDLKAWLLEYGMALA